jgi:Tol biopolymer transport system component
LQISTEGGPFPKWRNDGKEVVYLNQGKLMSVDVNDGSFGNPKLLFELPKEARGFQMAPDGQRFLILIPSADQNSDNIHFVSNWTQLLKR